jgi:hypothetical protein
MRLTLLKAKEVLASHAPADVLEDRINRAIELILINGKFNGSLDRIALQCLYGDVTLPRQWRTCEGLKIDRDNTGLFRVRVLTNGWYEFLEGKVSQEGGGSNFVQKGYGMDTVRSLGDGHAIMHDLPLGGNLVVTTTATPFTITIYGTDANYMPLTLSITSTTPVANPFTRITRIHKDQYNAYVLIQQVTTDGSNVTTDLARMEPTEEETYYRRYRDDNLVTVPTCNVIAYVKKRHLELTSDEDVLPITNITALGWAMDSLQYMAENDVSLSGQYQAAAINLLNEELRDSHSVDEVPGLRFHGRLPHLNSHY